MKTAMKLVALVLALAFSVSGSPVAANVMMTGPFFSSAAASAAAPSAAMAKTGKDSKVFQILQNETQFSIFYKALVDTTEIWNVEGRTVLDGQQLILFAPTDVALTDVLTEEVMTCLQKEPGQATLVSFLQYLQAVVPSCPQVKTPKQLLNLTMDGFLWTVGGKGIAVAEEEDGSIRLTSDDGMDSVTVQEARVTDPTVTLIPLEDSVIIQEDVSNNITRMCLDGLVSESSIAAPSSSASLPASEPSSGDADAASSESATLSESFRSLWELLF